MLLKSQNKIYLTLIAIFFMAISFFVFKQSKQDENYYKSQDIYEHFEVSKQIINGENPYLQILNSDMKKNNKYPTYLAGFYYLIMPTVKLYPDFNSWLNLWQVVTTIFYAGVGFLIFYKSYINSKTLLGILLALIWIFNRWSIYLGTTLSMDTIAIFLLLISLILINTKQKTSLFIYGVHLALKHLTTFLIPLYFIKAKRKNLVQNLLLLVIPIILVSIKFLIYSPNAYLKSVLFTATRLSESHFTVLSFTVSEIFKLQGLLQRLPMIITVCIIYLLFAKKKIEFDLSVLLVLLISITFNPVFFLQYEAWFIAVLLFYLPNINVNKPNLSK